MLTSEPIVNLPFGNIYGLNLTNLGDTGFTLSPGQARDSSDTYDIVIENPIIIDGTIGGANGLFPIIPLVPSNYYAIYVIASSVGIRRPAAIITEFVNNNGAPLLPPGYDIYRFISFWNTDINGHFFTMYQSGSSSLRTYFYDVPHSVIVGGASTTFEDVFLLLYVPKINNVPVIFSISYTPGAAGNICQFRPAGSISTNGYVQQAGLVAGVVQNENFTVLSRLQSTPQIDYKVTSGDTITIYVTGCILSI